MPIAITEYQGSGYGASAASGYHDPGLAVAFIARIERATAYGVSATVRSNWGWSGTDPGFKAELSGLADRDDCAHPTALWHVYAAYQQMNGRKARTTQSSGLEAYATMDSASSEARALIGNWSDSSSYNVTVNLNNLPDYVKSGSAVRVRTWTVTQTLGTAVPSMTVVGDTTYTVSSGNAVTFTPTLASDTALIVQVGLPSGTGGVTGAGGAAGAATGGTSTGGKAAGGSASGGKATGGSSLATGGTATGGRPTGGSPLVGGGGAGTAGVGGSGASGEETCNCRTAGAAAPSKGWAVLGLWCLVVLRNLRRRGAAIGVGCGDAIGWPIRTVGSSSGGRCRRSRPQARSRQL